MGQGMDAEQIYRNFREGRGTFEMQEVTAELKKLQETYGDRATTIAALQGAMEQGWTGEGGAAARNGAGPLVPALFDSATAMDATTGSLGGQADAWHAAANKVEPVPPLPEQPNPFTTGLEIVTGSTNEIHSYEAALEQRWHAVSTNLDAMASYENETGGNSTFPRTYGVMAQGGADVTVETSKPDAISGDVTNPSGVTGASGVTPSVPGVANVPVASNAPAVGNGPVPGGTPVSNPGGLPGGTPSPPGGTPGVPSAPGPAGAASTARPTGTPATTGPGGLAATAVPPNGRASTGTGRTGGVPRTTSGGPRTGQGVGGRPPGGATPGREGLPGGRVPAEGGARGGALGAGRGTGAVPPGGAAAAESAAARGGATTARGTGMMPVGAGAGRGKGDEDEEHQRKSYLQENDPDELFVGDLGHTAPPVIGERG